MMLPLLWNEKKLFRILFYLVTDEAHKYSGNFLKSYDNSWGDAWCMNSTVYNSTTDFFYSVVKLSQFVHYVQMRLMIGMRTEPSCVNDIIWYRKWRNTVRLCPILCTYKTRRAHCTTEVVLFHRKPFPKVTFKTKHCATNIVRIGVMWKRTTSGSNPKQIYNYKS